MIDWLLRRRDRLLGSPAFHQGVLRFAPTRWIARRRARELFDIAAGFVYSQTLAACVELDLFEQLAIGPRSSRELASTLSVPLPAMERLLAAAGELRLVQRAGRTHWRLGELGAASRGSPGISAMVRHHSVLYRDLGDPLGLLRDRSESGLGNYWAYAGKPGASEAENAERYSELMARSQSFVADDVLSHCALDSRQQLVDIGGGSGVFAAEALRRFPQLKAQVFDLADVATLAEQRFAREGLAGRGSARAGDMFNDELPTGADVISLVRILHDHDDDRVSTLLGRVRRAIRSDGLLVIAEPMAETPSAPGVGAYFQMYLWAMRSGRPRSLVELTTMLEAAGFADVRERKTFQPLLVRVITARPAALPVGR